MLTSHYLDRAAPSPECPRCGSALVVPAMAGGPSESVLQLRSSSAPAGGSGAFGEWLCWSCGLRWPNERSPAEVALAADDPEPEPSATPGDLIDLADLPEVQGSTAVTSRRVAATLRQARESRKLTISDSAKETRIGERYLQALEANASLEKFPAPIYARSFLRAYAEFLELETEGMLRRFDEDHPVKDYPIIQPLPDPPPRRRAVAGALVVASLLALISIAVARLESGREQGPGISPPASAAAEESPGRSSVTQPPLPPRTRRRSDTRTGKDAGSRRPSRVPRGPDPGAGARERRRGRPRGERREGSDRQPRRRRPARAPLEGWRGRHDLRLTPPSPRVDTTKRER